MITSAEMKRLEERCARIGISSQTLMENAGKAVFEILDKKFDLKDKKILVVCYHGNNGGDGFVAANYLSKVCEVNVLFIGDEEKLKPEAKKMYNKAFANKKIQFFDLDSYQLETLNFNNYDIIIDALLGIGIKGHPRESIIAAIDRINATNAFKVAIDVPSGLNPDTGETTKYVKADMIITFHDLKPGLVNLKDKVIIADIGIPKEI